MILLLPGNKNCCHAASTSNNDQKIDCLCAGEPTIASNWDVSIWKSENPDGDEVKLQNMLAQLWIINTLGPYKTYYSNEGWAGGYFAVGQDISAIKSYSHYHEKEPKESYLGVIGGEEFMGDL